MSIFKKHKTIADRSATDRRRHKEKIEKAIKEGIYDIVAEKSWEIFQKVLTVILSIIGE